MRTREAPAWFRAGAQTLACPTLSRRPRGVRVKNLKSCANLPRDVLGKGIQR